MHIVVMHVYTGAIIYRGRSELFAAKVITPGHIYGAGETEREAESHAMRRVAEQHPAVTQ